MRRVIKKLNNSNIALTSFKTTVVRTIGKGMGYLSRIIATHLVSPIAIGINELIITLINRLVPFILLGFDEFLQIFLSHNKKLESRKRIASYVYLLRFTFFISFTLGLLIFLAAGWIATFIFNKPNLKLAFQILGITLPAFTLQKLNIGALIGLKKPHYASFIETVSTPGLLVLFLIFGYVLHLLESDYSMLILYTIASLITFWLSLVFLSKHLGAKILKNLKQAYRPEGFLDLSKKIYSFVLVTTLGETLVTVIQGRYLTLSNFAVFKVLKRLTNITSIPTTSVINTIAPHLAESYNDKNLEKVRRLRKKSLKMLFWVLTPVFVGLTLFPWLLTFLLGNEFRGHTLLTIMLVLNAYLIDITSPFSVSLRMAKKQHIMTVIAFLGYTSAIALNVLLIPKLGIIGVGVAELTCTLVQRTLMIFMVYKLKL